MAELQPQFSSPGCNPDTVDVSGRRLEQAQMFWLTTVRPDGRPHVTPLVAVWLDDALYFSTGESERKAETSQGTRTACSRPDATPWLMGST